MTRPSPAADLLDRVRTLAAKYGDPPVPAVLMAAGNVENPFDDPLCEEGREHWPAEFHPRKSLVLRDWEMTYPDPPSVWYGVNLGGEAGLLRHEPHRVPAKLFPPSEEDEDPLHWLIGVQARCPADRASAADWAEAEIAPSATLTPDEWEERHRAAVSLLTGLRNVAGRAGCLLDPIGSTEVRFPAALGCGPARFGDDPTTLFLLAAFGEAERTTDGRPFTYQTARTRTGHAPLPRSRSGRETDDEPAGDGVGSGWTRWHYSRVGDLAGSMRLLLERLAAQEVAAGSSGAVATPEQLVALLPPPASTLPPHPEIPPRSGRTPDAVTGTEGPAAGEGVPDLRDENSNPSAGRPSPTSDAPAVPDWTLQGVVAEYGGKSIECTATEAVVLDVLIHARSRRALRDDIGDAIAKRIRGDRNHRVSAEEIKPHVSRLNRKLRKAFGLSKNVRPVFGKGRGAGGGFVYELRSDLLVSSDG